MFHSREVVSAAQAGRLSVRRWEIRDDRLITALQRTAGALRLAAAGSLWCIRFVKAWRAHRGHREELLSLHDEQLREAGISRSAVLEAAATPFWRAYPRLMNSVDHPLQHDRRSSMSRSALKTSLFVVASAFSIAAFSTEAFAICGVGSNEPVQVGAISSDPEKATLGLVCSPQDPERTASILSGAIGPIVAFGKSQAILSGTLTGTADEEPSRH